MGLQTHLGPQLTGTVKNPSPNVVNTAAISPNFLVTSPGVATQTGAYRNTGVGDATQFANVTSQTATAYYPYLPITTATGQTFNQPIVIPAGSFITGIYFDVTTAYTFTGSPTGAQIAINVVGAPGTTYAAGLQIILHGSTSALTAFTTPQRNQVGSTNGFNYNTGTSVMAYLTNTGATDTMIQIGPWVFTGGSSPAASAGAGILSVNYVVRNFDGSYYPQTPTSPIANPPVQTY
jgi:hypothetical protein